MAAWVGGICRIRYGKEQAAARWFGWETLGVQSADKLHRSIIIRNGKMGSHFQWIPFRILKACPSLCLNMSRCHSSESSDSSLSSTERFPRTRVTGH